MKRSIKQSIVVTIVTAMAVVCMIKANNSTSSFIEKNVEALTDGELCPGEKDNCIDNGERCLYYFNHANYNIEGKETKR